jgi:hypothetical protein
MNEIMLFAGKYTELEILLSKKSQAQKLKHHKFCPYVESSPKMTMIMKKMMMIMMGLECKWGDCLGWQQWEKEKKGVSTGG